MTRPSKALTRFGTAGVAAVVLGAGVPAYFAVSASAASNVKTVKVTQKSTAADCNPGTVTGTPVTNGASSTVTVTQTICVNQPVTSTVTVPGPTTTRTVTVTQSPSTPPTSPAPGCGTDKPATAINQVVIRAGAGADVVVTGTPGRRVVLFAYTRPSTTFIKVREAQTIPADGTLEFLVTPPRNTRVAALYENCTAPTDLGTSDAVSVQYVVSLAAKRNGVRNYTFSGRLLPALSGSLVSLYRVTPSGQQILTSQGRVGANGLYAINRKFTGSGRFDFFVKANGNPNNNTGTSNVRPTAGLLARVTERGARAPRSTGAPPLARPHDEGGASPRGRPSFVRERGRAARPRRGLDALLDVPQGGQLGDGGLALGRGRPAEEHDVDPAVGVGLDGLDAGHLLEDGDRVGHLLRRDVGARLHQVLADVGLDLRLHRGRERLHGCRRGATVVVGAAAARQGGAEGERAEGEGGAGTGGAHGVLLKLMGRAVRGRSGTRPSDSWRTLCPLT